MLNRSLVLLSFLLLLASFSSDERNQYWDRINKNLLTLVNSFPVEKVYVHTDRNLYQVGERMWFKVWHTEGSENRPSEGKVVVKLELLDPTDHVVQAHLLQCNDGRSCGSLIFPDTLPEGEYTIRAFSHRMFQHGENVAHKQRISLINPENNFESRKAFRKSEEEELSVTFYPEGGQLLASVKQRLGVEVLDGYGRGVKVQGDILDQAGKVVGSIATAANGVGSALVKLEYGEKYFFSVEDEGKRSNRFRLPPAQPNGAALSVESHSPFVRIKLLRNTGEGSYLVIIIHPDNSVDKFTHKLDDTSDEIIAEIDKTELGAGIHQVIAFNNKGLPVSERLFFVSGRDSCLLYPEMEQQQDGDSTDLILDLPPEWAGQTSTVSLSIVRSPGVSSPFVHPQSIPMLSEFMLGYAVKDIATNPYLYFKNGVLDEGLVDDMLMVRTWSRYDWEDLAKNELNEIEPSNFETLGISGRVSRIYLDIPAENARVNMTIMDEYFDQYSDTTDENGRFSFPGLEYYDTMNILLEARWKGDKNNLLIEVDENAMVWERDGESPGRYLWYQEINTGKANRRHKQLKISKQKRRPGSLHSGADHVVKFDRISHNYRSPLEALQTVPGVLVQGSGMNTRIIIRGSSSLILSNEPLYVLDDVQVDRYTVNSLYPGDVAKIEVLSGSRAAIYGAQGANGVVAVYTKRGNSGLLGELGIKVLGFTACKKFYIPKEQASLGELLPSTVAWYPMLTPDAKATLRVSFPKQPVEAALQLRLEALGKDGRIFSSGLRPLP